MNFLQKGINLILLPILTLYLTTFDYGIVAVVSGINAFLNIFYLLCLNASLNRFYYEYKEDLGKTKVLFGTILTFVFFFSLLLTTVLLIGRKWFLEPFLNNIEFYPFMVLGLISTLFNPLFTIFQYAMQATQEGVRYGKNNLMFFLTNVILVIVSVVVFKMGAIGVLGSLAVTNVIFFIFTISRFGKEVKFGINLDVLKVSLKYSIPLLPHSLSGVATNFMDRLFINNFLSTAVVGIYSLGSVFGNIVLFVATGINQSFVPWFNDKIKKSNYKDVPEIALIVVTAYCIIAMGLSLFSKEVIGFFTPESYHNAWKVVPFFAFAGVYNGVYYFFVAPLFYNIEKNGNRYIPIFTITSALFNLILNFILIQKYGFLGAAIATLISKFILALGVGMVYKKFLLIRYRNNLLLTMPLFFFIFSLSVFFTMKENALLIKLVFYTGTLIVSYLSFKKSIGRLKEKLSK